MLFADRDVIQALRAPSSSGAAEVAGPDPTRAARYSAHEIKSNRQGLRKDASFPDFGVFNPYRAEEFATVQWK